jgi:hypothetical protein
MEDSFDDLVVQINQKIAEVGKLLKEAFDLGKMTGLPCLGCHNDMIEYHACKDLDFSVGSAERNKALQDLEDKMNKIEFAEVFRQLDAMVGERLAWK